LHRIGLEEIRACLDTLIQRAVRLSSADRLRRKGKMKNRITVFVLVFSSLGFSGALAAKERRGADLVITKTNRQQVKGELIAVKPSSLLLLDSQTDADVSVEIGEIAVIKRIKNSQALPLGILGLAAGVILGRQIAGEDDESGTVAVHLVSDAAGAALGIIIGARMGKDKTIQIEGQPESVIKQILEDLRRQARVTNA
jgi:hypothetical protein